MGKKIDQLDVYDDVNTDKSRRDLFEVSKNTGTYASPTYATDGSRKISVEQLKETLFIKEINSYKSVTIGSPTFDKQSYNGIGNSGTYTLPTSTGKYEVLAIIIEGSLSVTVTGLGGGYGDLVFTNQNETAYLIDTTYGWYPLAVNKEVNSSAFELLANKENTTLDTSSTKYPTNNLVKTYVDNLGNILTSGLDTKLTKANNLSDLTNTTQARDNLLLGATNDVTHNSITLSNTTVSTLPFIDSAKKLISATGALLGTWFQTLTEKSTVVDADTIVVNDSASSFEAKKTTLLQLWSNYLLSKVQALGYLSGTVSNNTIPKSNGAGGLVNSSITDNGTTVSINNNTYLDKPSFAWSDLGSSLPTLSGANARYTSLRSNSSITLSLYSNLGGSVYVTMNSQFGSNWCRQHTSGTFLTYPCGTQIGSGVAPIYNSVNPTTGAAYEITITPEAVGSLGSMYCIAIVDANNIVTNLIKVKPSLNPSNYDLNLVSNKLQTSGSTASNVVFRGITASRGGQTNLAQAFWRYSADLSSAAIGGSTPNASAQLDLQATNKGFLPNRMTNAQRTAISSPAIGLMVYCTDATEGLYIYKSTGWTFII